jgi:hypothetical protein
MYDWPEAHGANKAFWSHLRDGLRARGVDAPDALLSHGTGWREAGLVFSQTCGWPWATVYCDMLDLVAVPVSAVPGCEGGTYSSMVIVRADSAVETLADLRGGSVAYNGLNSQSGVHTLREAVAPLTGGEPFFGRGVETLAHRSSVMAVFGNEADCAAIDAVCWAMFGRFEPKIMHRLRVIHQTAAAPALPFVTRKGGPVAAIREALEETVAAGLGEPLNVSGLVDPDEAAYRALVTRVADAPALFSV